mmetsp:Transcript_4839/g.5593  ORF Transcript_4839/g.5593 Transcript_4839/m.5593 type:complete len:400 (+) Transcript_4839:82-1281(+)
MKFTFFFLLLASVLFLTTFARHPLLGKRQKKRGNHNRKLIAGGEDAPADRFDYFATVDIQVVTDHLYQEVVGGVLITSNVVVFGNSNVNFTGVNLSDTTSHRIQVVLGNDATNHETFTVTDFKERVVLQGGFVRVSYIVAVLNASSSFSPVAVNDGTCEIGDGCLDVSMLGRGETVYAVDSDSSSSPTLGSTLAQSLQQLDFTFLRNEQCASQFDGSTALFDNYFAYYEEYFGCENLSCLDDELRESLIENMTRVNDNYAHYYEAYFDIVTPLFESGEALCLSNLNNGKGVCDGDLGAPVLVRGRDILVGLFLTELDGCPFDGFHSIFPTQIRLVDSLFSFIQTDIASLAGANTTIITPNVSSCSCESVPAPTSSADHYMMSFIHMLLPVAAIIFTLRE